MGTDAIVAAVINRLQWKCFWQKLWAKRRSVKNLKRTVHIDDYMSERKARYKEIVATVGIGYMPFLVLIEKFILYAGYAGVVYMEGILTYFSLSTILGLDHTLSLIVSIVAALIFFIISELIMLDTKSSLHRYLWAAWPLFIFFTIFCFTSAEIRHDFLDAIIGLSNFSMTDSGSVSTYNPVSKIAVFVFFQLLTFAPPLCAAKVHEIFRHRWLAAHAPAIDMSSHPTVNDIVGHALSYERLTYEGLARYKRYESLIKPKEKDVVAIEFPTVTTNGFQDDTLPEWTGSLVENTTSKKRGRRNVR